MTTLFPPSRRHTLYFLEDAVRFRPVHLQTDVDMTRIEAARRSDGAGRAGYTAYVVAAAARTLARYPDANAVMLDGMRPKLHRFASVDAKITLDKVVAGTRAVVSAVVSAADAKDLQAIQAEIAALQAEDVDVAPRYAPLRRLHRLPVPIARLAYAWVLRNPARRAALQGSFAVTSLGAGAVDTVQPMVAATITLGIGRVRPRPVAAGSGVEVRPVMQLCLAFDHRVIDGALAGEILGAVADRLQRWPADERRETA